MNALRDLGRAITLLTILPAPASWSEDEADIAGWFPAVGLLLGGIVFSGVQLLRLAGWSGRASLVVGTGVVAAFALLTRGLHWDGLADVADAWWGGTTPERRLEIMRDSHIGAFGTTAVVLALLAQAGAYQSLLLGRADPLILIVPAIGRLAASFAAWFGKPARADGLGRSVVGAPTVAALLPALFVEIGLLAGAWVAFGWQGAVFVLAGELVSLVVPHFIALRFGGVTGDVMGASVVVTETVILISAALAWGA